MYTDTPPSTCKWSEKKDEKIGFYGTVTSVPPLSQLGPLLLVTTTPKTRRFHLKMRNWHDLKIVCIDVAHHTEIGINWKIKKVMLQHEGEKPIKNTENKRSNPHRNYAIKCVVVFVVFVLAIGPLLYNMYKERKEEIARIKKYFFKKWITGLKTCRDDFLQLYVSSLAVCFFHTKQFLFWNGV